MDMKTNSISFKAIPGNEVVRRVSAEVNGDAVKINKFKKLFNDVFEKNIDANTVIDINDQNLFVFSHKSFPDYVIEHDGKYNKRDTFVHTMLQACPKEMFVAECKLIRKIVKEKVNSGIDFQALRNCADEFTNKISRQFFLNNIAIAERIKSLNPDSTLEDSEIIDTELDMLMDGELVDITTIA